MAITPQEALDCFASDDLIGIGMEADAVRRALHPDNLVTYAVASDSPVLLSHDDPLNPVAEPASSRQTSAVSAGLPLEAWLEAHRVAHTSDSSSTAELLFGLGETSENLVQSLFAIRDLQFETNGFAAFALRSADPNPNIEPPTAVEYLRTLAIARIVLDNIPSIESNCLAHGLKVTQMSLRFGANDAGSLATHAGSKRTFTEEDLRRVIRDAGFTPVERDPEYRTLFLNN